jgi:hypothetical protein
MDSKAERLRAEARERLERAGRSSGKPSSGRPSDTARIAALARQRTAAIERQERDAAQHAREQADRRDKLELLAVVALAARGSSTRWPFGSGSPMGITA